MRYGEQYKLIVVKDGSEYLQVINTCFLQHRETSYKLIK